MIKTGLYDPQFEHDACGVGFVGRLDGAARHEVVSQGLSLLCNLAHRGASGADADSGDGAGILLRLPDLFLRSALDFELPPEGGYGLGMVFLLQDGSAADRARALVQNQASSSGFNILGWREVPVEPEALGRTAFMSRPSIWQFVAEPFSGREPLSGEVLERRLYVLRKTVESEAARFGFSPDELYLASLSSRTVVYKGMMMAAQLAAFYHDLNDERVVSPFAIVHQRYSTNTFPSWRLAQPFRALAHNGEINTIRGNRNWLTAREPQLASPLFGSDIKKLFPLIEPDSSDSASLDNALEFLMRGGRSLNHSMAMLIPQAWGDKYPMGPNLRAFFEYHAGLMEPWDGPAAVVFTDGLSVGASLDRNGLRPARYSLLDDGLLVFASEAGALELPPKRVVEKGALRPGQMLLAEIGSGRLIRNAEIKSALSRLKPYRRWVRENQLVIPSFFSVGSDFCASVSDLAFRQGLFGYDRDDADIILGPMAVNGAEPTGSMGMDTQLAVLAERAQSLFSFFRQQFAQITNPPIDSIREELVMSLMTFIGYNPNILAEEPAQARLVKLRHPILSNDDLKRLEDLRYDDFHSATVSATFELPLPGARPGQSLALALARLEHEAFEAAKSGARIIVVSDKKAGGRQLPIPSLLAVAAVNRKLLETGDRIQIGLLCETGEARDVSHMAMLLSLGASAVNPWLAFETVADLAQRGELPGRIGVTTAIENYVKALCKGLLKIMSKMGISTLRSYRGAQIFEAVGLGQDLMDKYFPAIASRVGGIGLAHLERDAVRRWETSSELFQRPAASEYLSGDDWPQPLLTGGAYRIRRGGEPHLWTAETITLLQQAVRHQDDERYRRYAALINEQAEKAFTLRGLLDFASGGAAVPLAEVEPESAIMRRFVTGAMSFGSLSKEAHETLATAMNSIGARSNSGEGGEDPVRYQVGPDGRNMRSAIKQVASGRFGVTAEYLVNCDELQIKIAQGAKPGEGGQLPGPKVDSEIARVRHSTAGVTLISPPPHHDIYSIEDIAQLIYDLYQANDRARVSVKLVSEIGVGTIAAGVAKAMAGTILISGFDGGTGASPLSSIKHAGSPWEIGLAETQQTLVLNRLRGRVKLQADGQMKTGRDVVVAALLGADEFGFATAPLVSLGCLMMRKCHTNGCPVGVATQNPRLRARFAGRPEHLVNYFTYVAREVREIMASLGFRTMEAMTGRVDCLRPRADSAILLERGLDFAALLTEPQGAERRFLGADHEVRPTAQTLDDGLLPAVEEAIAAGRALTLDLPVHNTDRTVGAKISSRIVRARGLAGLPDGAITLNLTGTAGQSFGAFAARGLTIHLSGEANDYVGKGLSGGRLIVRPPRDLHPDFEPGQNAIAGNVALYGATSGELYLCGWAGERFAVRNSGARAVVEGVGDHGCEYMTGGRVVVLGLTGVNFAAGMSGGLAYVYDQDGLFDSRCNLEMVDLDLLEETDEAELRSLIESHAAYTDSLAARHILLHWEREKGKFVKVFPMEYRRVLGEMSTGDAATPRRENQAA
ncbi:MAG: glutamate synthase large subunit [Candidatus Adiutrix sp.]|jgi:glutamate synthase domain-containing protein 2/glutamate synthase domain-containing protein 1/glutamate synthase domain-containing protein 3|nr:glutamate synthase large subunit [Candidatus Adiutrix sp.]